MREQADEGVFDHTLHGGAAPVRMQWYFRERTRLPVAVQSWRLAPGASEGMHAHPADDPLEELYVLVSGRATMRVDGETHELRPGDAVLAPTGSDHDLRNDGDADAHLLVVWGPPGTPLDWARFGSGRAAHDAAAEPPAD